MNHNADEENFSFDFEQKFSEVTRASMRLRIHNNPQMEQKLVLMKDALFQDLMDCINPDEGFDVGGSSYVSAFSFQTAQERFSQLFLTSTKKNPIRDQVLSQMGADSSYTLEQFLEAYCEKILMTELVYQDLLQKEKLLN